MRGKKAKQLRKNVYGDMHHKTDYTGKLQRTSVRVGRALNKNGTRKKDNLGRALSVMKSVLRVIPKFGESSIRVGKLRREYKDVKKSCYKGVAIKYT